jgi:hypothetical protein
MATPVRLVAPRLRPGGVKGDEAWPGQDGLRRQPAHLAGDMGEDAFLLVIRRSQVDMAALAGQRGVAPVQRDERADAEAGSGSQHDAGPGSGRDAADRLHHRGGQGRQGQRLSLEVVEKQAVL